MAGLGQRVYLNKNISLRIDYRLQRYTETVREKTITSLLYTDIGTRTVWGNVITLGVTYMFGFGGGAAAPAAK
jgi:spore coat protein U-like protein